MIFARQALIDGEFVANVRLSLEKGRIAGLTVGEAPAASDTTVDTLLPGLANLHSHSFQRAMAGMTEYRAAGRESFWTWRETMYRFLDHLTPELIEAIAALVFVEMMEAGFSSVGEFHYVHHQAGGRRYDDMAELSQRIMAAAAETGIGLTHLPVLYSYGGAGKQPLAGGQLRFGNDVEAFLELVAACRKAAKNGPGDMIVGIAPHSLRATAPDELARLLDNINGCPIHIHIAEQPKEVADIAAWLGMRPVEWALAHLPLGPDWCTIHATHMTADETLRLARSGAVAGLCPITEANLGDGPFNGPGWLTAKGAFGVGSDSNVRISLTEELRTLEYSQRLRDLARNVLTPGEGSVGTFLYRSAAAGGAQALGRESGDIAIGKLADLVAIDSRDASLCALAPHRLLDGLVFASSDRVITDVWSAGRHQVRHGRHIARDSVIARWRKAVAVLAASL